MLFPAAVLNLTADNAVRHLYIDGCESTYLANWNVWEIADSVVLSLTASVIAVEIGNDVGDVGGLLASTDTIRTDGTWKVTTNYTPGWMDMNFDDTTWNNATTYGITVLDRGKLDLESAKMLNGYQLKTISTQLFTFDII